MPKGTVGKLEGRAIIAYRKPKKRGHPKKRGPKRKPKPRLPVVKKKKVKRLKGEKNYTPKERRFIAEYLKCGVATQAALAAYNVKNRRNAGAYGHNVLNRPKIQRAIDLAMKKAHFDENFAVGTLKDLVIKGSKNLDETKPTDVLRGLEIFLKLKGYLDKRKEPTLKISIKERANKMTVGELQKEMDKLNKRYEDLVAFMNGPAEEGEVVDEG